MQFTFLGDNSPKPFSFDYLGDNTPPAAAPAPAAAEDDEDEEDALDDHEALDHIGDVGPEVFVDYSTFEDRDGSDGSTQEEPEENPMRASARRESAALEFDDFLGGGGDYEEEPEANPMARHGGAPKKRGSAAFVDAAASYPEDGGVVLAENPMAAHRTAANYDAASLDDLDEPSLVGPTRRASEAPPARERAKARATRSRTEPPVYAAGPPGLLFKPKKRRSSLKDDLLARQTTAATRRSSSLREDLLSGANPMHPRRRSSGADSAASRFDFDEHFGHDLGRGLGRGLGDGLGRGWRRGGSGRRRRRVRLGEPALEGEQGLLVELRDLERQRARQFRRHVEGRGADVEDLDVVGRTGAEEVDERRREDLGHPRERIALQMQHDLELGRLHRREQVLGKRIDAPLALLLLLRSPAVEVVRLDDHPLFHGCARSLGAAPPLNVQQLGKLWLREEDGMDPA